MGGTLDRLVEHGYEVHIAYQTSGNLAVSNEALKFVEVSEILNPTPNTPSFSFKE
jgi:glucosamine-6-phosphate deaminase